MRDYEGLKPWFDRTQAGEADVLWPGRPLYLAKTSGTTSGTKYIPLTAASIGNHIGGARDALLHYIHATGRSQFLDGKLMFLSGSPALEQHHGIHTGRLSGIVNHHVPSYLRRNQLPSYDTNIIEDWEAKLDRIVDETLGQPMTLISGIPPWVQMYFDRIQARTGRPIQDVFPDFNLFVYGGVNFAPYRAKLFETIGRAVDSIELFPASEGFLAFQDQPGNPGLLLLLNSGIFFEFVPAERFFEPNPPRLHIADVELDKQYAVVLTSNAGLWGYSLGDTVRFVDLQPAPRRRDGPHQALSVGFWRTRHRRRSGAGAARNDGATPRNRSGRVHRGPPRERRPRHALAPRVAARICPPPARCRRLRRCPRHVPAPPKHLLRRPAPGQYPRAPAADDATARCAFQRHMKSLGKLGGQNKVPRLSNDRGSSGWECANKIERPYLRPNRHNVLFAGPSDSGHCGAGQLGGSIPPCSLGRN